MQTRMGLGLGLGMTRGAGGAFDPASLFAASEDGVFYDTSDLGTLWANTTGTTPATVGGAVARVDDKSGNGNNLLQASAGLRPILRQDADGQYYLEEGSSRYLRATFAMPQPFDRITALRQNAITSSGRVLSGAATNTGELTQFASSFGLSLRSQTDLSIGKGSVQGVNSIITERFNGASSRGAINDAAYTTGNAGTDGTDGITVGAASTALGSGFSVNIRFYGMVMIGRSLTTDEIANTRAFFGRKANRSNTSTFAASSSFVTVDGVRRYSYQSSYVDTAAGFPFARALDVLLPDSYAPENDYPLVVVLGVEPFVADYADELQVIKTDNLHNTTGAIFCRLNTRILPWWGVKNDGSVNYEALIRDGVVPWMRENFSIIAGREGVSLLGYSKGGFGAFSLILRNPNDFGYAASWDAPLTSAYGAGSNGLAEAFGSSAQYNLFLPGNILAANKSAINDKSRIVHSGFNLFNSDVVAFEAQLVSESVPHTYLSVSRASHNANSGWMPSVVGGLAALW